MALVAPESGDQPAEADRPGSLEAAMDRFAGGDNSAFADVYRLSAPRLYGLFLRLGKPATQADDLSQETYLRVCRGRDGYRRGAKVLPWIYAIARRLVIDRARERRRDRALDEAYGICFASAGGPPAADEEIAARRMEIAIGKILGRIPPAQALAFRLIKEDGLSLSEASALLGDTNLAIRLRTHRACKAIREGLRDHI